MKYFLIVLTFVICGFSSRAQTPEDSIKVVINTLFTAMKNADPDLLRSCFADSIIIQTISRNQEGKHVILNENPTSFIEVISKEKPGNADERITFESIKIDGPLAIAWTPYQFYYKGKFSHCGVNSFQLVQFDGKWKIQYLIDTRRRLGCPGE